MLDRISIQKDTAIPLEDHDYAMICLPIANS
jgi:hypothetical protein